MDEQNPNPYDAVVADLERQRDELDLLIASLRARAAVAKDASVSLQTAGNGTLPAGLGVKSAGAKSDVVTPDTFFGMKIPEAIRQYLSMTKRPTAAAMITKALLDGGLQSTSKNFPASVQTALTRMRGEVVKVPNGWALAEWYPGRSFENKPSKQKKKRRTKKGGRTSDVQAASSSGKDVAASRKLQGQYLGLLRKIPEGKRETFKAIAKRDGREQAIKAMTRAVNEPKSA